MIITVVGLGLIGGSMALDLRREGFASDIIGVDASEVHAKRALNLGIVNRLADLHDGVAQADVVIVAIPVDKIALVLPEILDYILPSTTVIDVGSTKKQIGLAVANHKNRGNYVATHPMSGTENSGPDAALEHLFEKKICIICDQEASKPQHLALVEKMYHSLGMDLAYMTSDEQDHTTAHVSHLPHITAFALANAVLEGSDRKIIFDLASGGFRSTVRLAKSSPEMWGPIFSQNKQYVVEALDLYLKELEKFRVCIANSDREEMDRLMRNANHIREALNGEASELIRKEETTTKFYTK